MKHSLKETTHQLVNELGEVALNALSIVCLSIGYFVIGLVLAVPYTLLAGGLLDNFIMTVMLSPIVTSMLFFLWFTRPIGRERDQKLGVGDYSFWGFVTYLGLPILLNGTSLLLRSLGYEAAAQIVFAVRYPILVLLPGAFFVVLLLASGVVNAWTKMIGLCGTTPPPTPPSNPGQPPHLRSEQQPSQQSDATDFGSNHLQMIPTT